MLHLWRPTSCLVADDESEDKEDEWHRVFEQEPSGRSDDHDTTLGEIGEDWRLDGDMESEGESSDESDDQADEPQGFGIASSISIIYTESVDTVDDPNTESKFTEIISNNDTKRTGDSESFTQVSEDEDISEDSDSFHSVPEHIETISFEHVNSADNVAANMEAIAGIEGVNSSKGDPYEQVIDWLDGSSNANIISSQEKAVRKHETEYVDKLISDHNNVIDDTANDNHTPMTNDSHDSDRDGKSEPNANDNEPDQSMPLPDYDDDNEDDNEDDDDETGSSCSSSAEDDEPNDNENTQDKKEDVAPVKSVSSNSQSEKTDTFGNTFILGNKLTNMIEMFNFDIVPTKLENRETKIENRQTKVESRVINLENRKARLENKETKLENRETKLQDRPPIQITLSDYQDEMAHAHRLAALRCTPSSPNREGLPDIYASPFVHKNFYGAKKFSLPKNIMLHRSFPTPKPFRTRDTPRRSTFPKVLQFVTQLWSSDKRPSIHRQRSTEMSLYADNGDHDRTMPLAFPSWGTGVSSGHYI